tara:strand:+ start:3735 stop:6350 length:2616 start_codon:yes stop_codon:yes gene_type:complete
MSDSDLQSPQGKHEEEPTIQTPNGSTESEDELIIPSTEPTAIPEGGDLEAVDTIVIKDGESYRQMKVFSVKKLNESKASEDTLVKNEEQPDGTVKKTVLDEWRPKKEGTESIDCEFCEGKGKVIVEKKGVKECPRCEGEGTVESNEPNQEQVSQDVEMPQEVPQQEEIPQEVPVEEEVPLDEFEENEKLWDESEESIAVEEFKEDEHPRASDGKFGSGGGSSDKPKEDKPKEDKKDVKDITDDDKPKEEDWKESSGDFKKHIKDGIKKARTKNGGNDEDLSSQKMIFKTKNDVADMSDEELFELANGSQMVQAQSSAYIHKYNKAGDKRLVTNNMKNIPDDYYHDYMDTLRSEIIMDLGLHDKGTDRTPEESLQHHLEKFQTDMEKGKKPHRGLQSDIEYVMRDLEFNEEDTEKAKNIWSSSRNTRVTRGSKKGLNNRHQIMRAIGIAGDINSRFENLSGEDKNRLLTYSRYVGESKASEEYSAWDIEHAVIDDLKSFTLEWVKNNQHGGGHYNETVHVDERHAVEEIKKQFVAIAQNSYDGFETSNVAHGILARLVSEGKLKWLGSGDGIFGGGVGYQASESKADEDDSCGCKAKSMEAYQSFVSNKLEELQSKAKSGESVGLLYGQEVEVDGRKIKGTLAYAGVSLNDRIYLPEELAKGDGLTLPLLLNHSSISGAEMELDRLDDTMKQHLENGRDFKVGEVTLEWIPDKLTLYYEGEVTDNFFKKEIDEMNMSVSLGIYYDSDSPSVCNDKCYTVITGAEFREVSLVYHAGFPIATIEEVESGLKSLGESVSKVKSYECKACNEGGMFEATEKDTTTYKCMSCGEIDWTVMNKSMEAQLLPQLYLPENTMSGIKIPTVIIGKSEDTQV